MILALVLAAAVTITDHFALNENPQCRAWCSCPVAIMTLYTSDGCTQPLLRKLDHDCKQGCKERVPRPKTDK